MKTKLFFCGSLCQLGCTPICHRSNPVKKFLTKMFSFFREVHNYQTYKCQVWSNLTEKKVTHILTLSFQWPSSSQSQHMNCHPKKMFWVLSPSKERSECEANVQGILQPCMMFYFTFQNLRRTYLQLNHILRRQFKILVIDFADCHLDLFVKMVWGTRYVIS